MANKVGLTDAKIAGLKAPAAGQIELADGIVPGLRLRMGASGIKTYILRKRVQGKWLNVTIGRHGPSFTLAHARKKARDLLVDVEQGKSIARKAGAKRKGSKGVGTVAELYETYLAQQIEGKKRSAREFDRVFRKYIEPEIGDRLADSITRSDVSRFVEKIAFERGKETLTMARIVYRHLSTFYTWALTRLEHMPANPCRDAWRPKRNEPRDRVLSDRELAALWQSAVEDGYPFGHLVQMLVLTAQRRGEVLDAACDEFDFKAKVWTVPGDRAKNGKANVVPLSAQALAVITEIFMAAGIDPDDAHKQSQILLASKVTKACAGLVRADRRRSERDCQTGIIGIAHCQMALFRIYDAIWRTAMLALQPVDTAVTAFRPDPITQDEAAAMFRAVLNLFGKWELTDEQAATLLDMPVRSYRRWKAEGPGRVSRDGRARLSNLMGIHKALRIIFSEATRGYAWIRATNDAFGGVSGLDVMLGGELTDIMRVRRYLDAERGGW